MNTNYRVLASAGLIMAAAGSTGHSATVIRTVGPYPNSSSFDVLFPTVKNVNELVSISDGSVYTGEAYGLSISAINTDDILFEIFSPDLRMFETLPLEDYTLNDFTPFATPQNLKGFRFEFVGGPGPEGELSFPSDTTFTFSVPEPSAALLAGLGPMLLMRRRRK